LPSLILIDGALPCTAFILAEMEAIARNLLHAFQGMSPSKGADALLLIVGEPMAARHPGVMLVDLAEAMHPIVGCLFMTNLRSG
jgi:hypothetical protein